jgi:hypothetical protein
MRPPGTGLFKIFIKKLKNKYHLVHKQNLLHMLLHIQHVKPYNQKLLHNKSDNNINIGICMSDNLLKEKT